VTPIRKPVAQVTSKIPFGAMGLRLSMNELWVSSAHIQRPRRGCCAEAFAKNESHVRSPTH